MTTATTIEDVQEEVQQQAGKLVNHFAGYVGFKTIEIGLSSGLLETLANETGPINTNELAKKSGTDSFYTEVWAKAAYAAEILEVDSDDCYSLAAQMSNLLINEDFPGYVGGVTNVFSQPEFFDIFTDNLKTGNHIWWEDTSPEFITAVSKTGWPFYTRLIPDGLDKVPGLTGSLAEGAKVLELASGVGRGLVKFANTYPNSTLIGVDGDRHSIEASRERIRNEDVDARVKLVHSPLEDFVEEDTYDLVFINISMHECRDIDLVTQNVRRSLKPGGWFVISDFPFPATHEGLRTPGARMLTGIQYYEAQIDDQLLPTDAFVDLLNRNGFKSVESTEITPVHNLIFGQK